MARWWSKVKHYQPPVASIQSVYELEDYARGRVVFLVAPGATLDQFPREELERPITVGVNAALELVPLNFWLFQEGTFCRRYHKLYTSDRVRNIVTTDVRAADPMQYLLPAGKRLFFYNADPPIHTFWRDELPHWHYPLEHFLPGRNTITANAFSLIRLMNPKACILVGVDFAQPGGLYYADGVRRNPGPRLRHRALSAGRAWCLYAIRHKTWKGTPWYTTSPHLRLGRMVQQISVEDAVEMARTS